MEAKNNHMKHAYPNKSPEDQMKIREKMSMARRNQTIKVTLPTIKFLEKKD